MAKRNVFVLATEPAITTLSNSLALNYFVLHRVTHNILNNDALFFSNVLNNITVYSTSYIINLDTTRKSCVFKSLNLSPTEIGLLITARLEIRFTHAHKHTELSKSE